MGLGRLWGVGAAVLDLRGLQGHRDVEEDVLKQIVGPLLMQRGWGSPRFLAGLGSFSQARCRWGL